MKKFIHIRRGCREKLAEECGVSIATVDLALRYNADTDLQNMIREKSKKYIKRF